MSKKFYKHNSAYFSYCTFCGKLVLPDSIGVESVLTRNGHLIYFHTRCFDEFNLKTKSIKIVKE